ncbi:hypothetical protein SAMN05444405_104199 [Bacteroides luti]|uniref:CarboxypepD_reg-like domain-containing protein n=1 Tax=Bacteroides luti TaxID=1297750 RepID=A0A1M4Y2V8_9BACE|nr:hypothetical protein [Bacteroides luti]SHF00091.1 hypothetical protein SAMN05444405_104199 [Bacteroides luti]
MKKYLYIIGLIFLIVFTSCESDKLNVTNFGMISGKVMDGDTYLPVSGVMISTTPASLVLLSDAEGKFTIPKIKEGDIAVNLTKKNYLSNSLIVETYGEETTQMDLLMYRDTANIGTITFSDPVPANGAVQVADSSATFSWKVNGLKSNLELTYNIYFFESNSTVQNLLGEDVVLKQVITGILKPKTTYYWYVLAKLNGKVVAFSPTWSFTTGDDDK